MITAHPPTNLSPERWRELVAWYGEFCASGGRLAVLQGALYVDGPDWLLTPAVLDALRDYRAALLTLLSRSDCPAVAWRHAAMLTDLARRPHALDLTTRPSLVAAPGCCCSCGEPLPVTLIPEANRRCPACTTALQLALRRIREADLS